VLLLQLSAVRTLGRKRELGYHLYQSLRFHLAVDPARGHIQNQLLPLGPAL